MTDTKPILEIKNLVTQFDTRTGPFKAVDDVSVSLYPGRTLCVVGESGSGKSVMSRSVLQIVDQPGRIASGEILFRSPDAIGAERTVDLAKLGPRSKAMQEIRGRDIAMIFQEPMSSLSPVHKVGDQIGESLRLHEKLNKSQAWERSIELLRQVEIPNPETAANRYPFEFSGGMRQRVMIAMALACNPKVLIADEPTTALDVTIQAEILDLMRNLQKKSGMALLFITHDMGVVAEIADDIAVMRFGKVVETGSVFDVFESPQHEYTKRLLQSVKDLDRPAPRRVETRQLRPLGQPIVTAAALRKEFAMNSGLFGRKQDIFVALDDIHLELRVGENLGIVGESGSGKTTLGRCIQRVYGVTDGTIEYRRADGKIDQLASMSEAELKRPWGEIRTIFQDPFASLNPRMTIGQIIGEPLLVRGSHSGEALRRRVAELLDMVGLPSSAMERYPHAFSGGQRQRISIARAIAPNPRVVIADEATSALDVSIRTQVLDLLLDLQQQLDLSFIFISHDIAVIRYFCDNVAVMHRGRIVETGTAEQICDAPQHPYTKSLLSAVLKPDPRLRGTQVRSRYHPESL